jgi:hypothetical protein
MRQATTPDVVILAGDADRAMVRDFTKHNSAELNNRDTNWGVVVFVLSARQAARRVRMVDDVAEKNRESFDLEPRFPPRFLHPTHR